MAGYIGAKVGTVTANAADIKGDISATDTTPEITLKNTTETDADGSRGGKITFKGEQSGGEESTLANIQASHDGTADDEKGDLIFRTNDGSDGASPTERMRIDSVGTVTITNASNDTQLLLESTDADASSGPVLELFRNSASPADNDLGGAIEFHAENDADEKIRYQAIFTYLPDVSDGSEDGAFIWFSSTLYNKNMEHKYSVWNTVQQKLYLIKMVQLLIFVLSQIPTLICLLWMVAIILF